MAVIMSTGNDVFLKHVLKKHPQELGKALTLLGTGMTLEVSIYSLKLMHEGQATQLGTLTSTSNLMKYTGSPANDVYDAAIAAIAGWFDTVWASQMGPVHVVPETPDPVGTPSMKEALAKDKAAGIKPTIKPAPTVFDAEIEQAAKATIFPEPGKTVKSTPEEVAAHQAMVQKVLDELPGGSPQVKKQPKPGVIKLALAEVVGQKVLGTSADSVYKAIAISPGVKVAARINGSQLSLRVETTSKCTPSDLEKIKASGVQWHSTYGSIHLDTGNPQIMRRTIGAFLFGMDVKFTDQLSAGEAA